MEKILCIIRTSTLSQEVASQKHDMEDYLASLGYSPDEVHWLISPGASARSLNEKYLKMIKEIKDLTRDIKAVALWHLNRLGRVESKLMEMKEYFITHGVQVYVKNPQIILLDENGKPNPAAEISWSIFSTMTKFETEEMMMKMKRGKDEAARAGKFCGYGVPYGFMVNQDNYIIVNPETAPQIVKLFSMYLEGATLRELRDYINQFGMSTSGQYVQRMLRNRKYIEIVGEETFNKVLEIKKTRTHPKSRSCALGSLLIRCPVCGRHYVHDGKQSYRCISSKSRAMKGPVCTNGCTLNQPRLDCCLVESTWRYYNRYLHKNGSVRLQEIAALIVEHPLKVKAIRAKIEAFSEVIQRAAESYIDGIITKTVRDSKISSALKEKKDIENELNRMEARLSELKDEEKQLREQFREVGQSEAFTTRMIDNMEKKELYNLVHKMIDRVDLEITPEGKVIRIHSKVDDEIPVYRFSGCGRGFKLEMLGPAGEFTDITSRDPYSIKY